MTTNLAGYPAMGWGVYREKPTGISINDRPPLLPRHVERMLYRKMMHPPIGDDVISYRTPYPRFRKRKLLKENPMSQMGAGRRRSALGTRRKRKPRLARLAPRRVPLSEPSLRSEFAQTIGFGKKTYGKRRRIYRKKH